MKTLIIIANPSKTSFSHAMAHAYSEKCEDFEILDLYEVNQWYLTYESTDAFKKWEVKGSKIIKEMQEKITTADELAFFFPIWWSDYPAILKNFFDSNFSAWFAFNFLKWWKVEKLLTGKTAKIFCTCGAPSFIYSIPFIMWIKLKSYFKKAILGFCWITLTDYVLIGSIEKKTEPERKELLKNIFK